MDSGRPLVTPSGFRGRPGTFSSFSRSSFASSRHLPFPTHLAQIPPANESPGHLHWPALQPSDSSAIALRASVAGDSSGFGDIKYPPFSGLHHHR